MNLTIEIPDDCAARIQAQAQARGMTIDRWLLELAEQNAPVSTSPHATAEPPIWEVIAQNMEDLPDDEFRKIPPDAASQIDHYLYGHPKR
jgi:hypothetical protein